MEARHARCTCGALVEVHVLEPVVTASGAIESRCPACDSDDAQGDCGESFAASRADARRPWRRYALAGAAAVGVVVIAASARSLVPSPAAVAESFAPAALASPSARTRSYYAKRASALQAALHRSEDEPPGEDLGKLDALEEELPPTIEDLREQSGVPLEERLPTLRDWVFPVVDSDEEFPLRRSRRFGAAREGVDLPECGRGHCGVDLDGERGTPVVAVAWGVVARIVRIPDRRSGMYVRLEHPDYVYTSYMHLDSIAEGLRVGDEVQAGQMVGTLGRTGIKHSAAHLHFSLEVPDGSESLHIDPIRYLRRATRRSEPVPAD